MSTNTDGPEAKKITLTYDEESDIWIARAETRGVTARASTRSAALQALDETLANGGTVGHDIEVSLDDPFFSAPSFSSGRSDVSQNVEEYLAKDLQEEIGPDEDS